MTDHRAALRAALGRSGDVVQALTPEESERLLGLLRRAQAAQRRSLDASIDEALKVLPRFVRIPARSILFGK
ncbi:hypothetical protein [Nocardia jejuensis]|uniref:hypothetical protein n=1 Tax=Nocardia jejuensis TaxID=328049 RepID=UPI000A545BF3|nr:hypothetical protein [Nocardia jejuensis]